MEAHLAAVGFGQRLARDDLEEQHQLETVAEVVLDVLDARAGLAQVRVAPRRKRLQTHNNDNKDIVTCVHVPNQHNENRKKRQYSGAGMAVLFENLTRCTEIRMQMRQRCRVHEKPRIT